MAQVFERLIGEEQSTGQRGAKNGGYVNATVPVPFGELMRAMVAAMVVKAGD